MVDELNSAVFKGLDHRQRERIGAEVADCVARQINFVKYLAFWSRIVAAS